MKKLMIILMLALAFMSLLLCHLRSNSVCATEALKAVEESTTKIKSELFECFDDFCIKVK